MRSYFFLLALGTALGFAILGLHFRAASSYVDNVSVVSFRTPDVRQAVNIVTESAAIPVAPFSHRDSNSEDQNPDEVWLNQNIIDGAPTRICTDEPLLYRVLQTAIERWHTALGSNWYFDLLSPPTTSCATVGPTNFDVYAHFGECRDPDADACYRRSTEGSPSRPRRLFRSSDSRSYASLIIKRSIAETGGTLHASCDGKTLRLKLAPDRVWLLQLLPKSSESVRRALVVMDGESGPRSIRTWTVAPS